MQCRAGFRSRSQSINAREVSEVANATRVAPAIDESAAKLRRCISWPIVENFGSLQGHFSFPIEELTYDSYSKMQGMRNCADSVPRR